MKDILSKLDLLIEKAVSQVLREEFDERQLQKTVSKTIKGDKRKLRAADKGNDQEEIDEEEEVEVEEKITATDDDGPGGDMSRRKVKIPSKLPAAITVDMVVQSINALRSSRSLKDPQVKEDLDLYFQNLDANEKIALVAFLNGLAETLIGGEGIESIDPSDPPYNVKMDAKPKQKSQERTAPKHITTDETGDTSDGTPIVVGGM